MTVVLSSPTDRIELEKAIKEASGSLTRIDAERDLIKAIASKVKEDLEIKPAFFNQLVKVYHKQSRDAEEQKVEGLLEIYDQVFPK